MAAKGRRPFRKAPGFRNLVAHAYGTLDLARVHRAVVNSPADLLAFVAALETLTPPSV